MLRSKLTVVCVALAMAILVAACSGQHGSKGEVTFTKDIAPILFESCAPCHRPGESAPFSLLTFDDAEQRAQQIAQVTQSRFMPPWLPEPGEPGFLGERRLTDRQIDLIRRWYKHGTVEGDPADLPPMPRWTEGWQLGEPDLVVTMKETFTVPAQGFDVFRNFVIPIPVERTRYVRAVELRPGNKRIVHHAIMRIDRTPSSRRRDEQEPGPGFGGMRMGDAVPPDGHFLGWTPGKMPYLGSGEMAWRLDRGTDLVLQLHMLPTGRPETIQPSIGFYFAEKGPRLRPFVIALDSREIDIPAGEKAYVIEDEITLPVPVELLQIYPHAHYLGKIMEVDARLPGGARKTLLRIDDWDFNWQDEYRYTQRVPLPAGTVVSMRYTYDNSSSNERNPNIPPKRVFSGNSSMDEMGTLSLQVLPRDAADWTKLQEAQARHSLTKEPDHWAAINNLGTALLAQGRTEEAIRQFRKATALHPGLDEAHYNLGLALASQDRLDEAAECYREALRVNPSFARAVNNLGNVLLAQGRVEEALRHYRKASELQSDFDEAYYNLGNVLLELGRPEEAIVHYGEALRINPNFAMTHNNLAVALQSQGRQEEALLRFNEALRIDPRLVEAHRNLGVVLSEQGKLDEAIEHLRVALSIDPDDELAGAQLRAAREKQRLTRNGNPQKN